MIFMRVPSLFILFFSLTTQAVFATEDKVPCADYSGQYQCTTFDATLAHSIFITQRTNENDEVAITVENPLSAFVQTPVEFVLNELPQSTPEGSMGMYVGSCQQRSIRLAFYMGSISPESSDNFGLIVNYAFSHEGDFRLDMQLVQVVEDDWGGENSVHPLQQSPTTFCKKISQQ